MGDPSRITLALSRWIDEVAAAILAGMEELRAAPHLHLAEQKDGSFVAKGIESETSPDSAGMSFRLGPGGLRPEDTARVKSLVEDTRVDVFLKPDRFLFRPLELPSRAGEFLEGIVHAQIDRLTPWGAADAMFGWGAPVATTNGRMEIVVAATGRGLIEPLTDALSGLGAVSIRLYVRSPEPGAEPILVSDQNTRTTREAHRMRRILLYILGGLAGFAALAILALVVAGSILEAKQAGNTERIDAIRSALQASRDPSSEPVAVMLGRKREAPSSVLVLEALSEALPDHTYVTELRMQDGKVQIIGMTGDAPSLIALLEKSPQLSEASFFAPTTRSQSTRGDHFHIEAKIRQYRAAQP